MGQEIRRGKIVSIVSSSFLLVALVIALIVWYWPSPVPPVTEVLKNALVNSTPSGVELIQLTASSVLKQNVVWSPNGENLSYVKWYQPEIYNINVAQRNESQLTNWKGWGSGGLGLLAYSDDGRALFLGANENLWAQPADGGEPRSLISSSSASWVNGYGARFGGGKAAFFTGVSPCDLQVLDLNTGTRTLLAGSLADSMYASLDISRDGKKIVYTAGVRGQSDPTYPNKPRCYTWTINADGTGKHQIKDKSTSNLRWQPNGSKVAFLFDNELHTINSDGTDEVALISQGDNILRFEWSPDGNSIAYWLSKTDWDYGTSLWILDVRDGAQKCVFDITNTGVYWERNKGMVWSPDSESIGFILSGVGGQQVFVLKLK